MRSDGGLSQHVMFPEVLILVPEHQTALAETEGELQRLGFTLEHEEGETWRITSVPADLNGCDPKDIVMRILESVTEDSANYGSDQRPVESILERMVLIMARSAAITRGRRLTPEEMEHLVAELFALPDPSFTPNGNRIYARLDESSLMRLLA